MNRDRIAMLAPIVCAIAAVALLVQRPSDAQTPAREVGLKPVEESMHEFMEYVFQPTYLRLKASIAQQPESNEGWKLVKSDSLILAEATNLLLSRSPEKKPIVWKAHAASVRDAGAALYAAAKKKDYGASRAAYVGMIQQCNKCHQSFAEGEYQLEP